MPRRGGNIDSLTFEPTMLFIGHQVCGQRRGAFHCGAHHTEAAQALLETIPRHRIPAKDVGNGPTRNMETHEKQRLGHVVRVPAPIRHDQSRRHGVEDLVVAYPQATTTAIEFRRPRRRAIEDIAWLKGRRKQRGVWSLALCKSLLGEGILAEKRVILVFGQRETQSTVAFLGLTRSSGHGCLRWRESIGQMCFTLSHWEAAFKPTFTHQQNPLPPDKCLVPVVL